MRLFVAKSLFIHIPVDFTVTLIMDQIITDKDVKFYDLKNGTLKDAQLDLQKYCTTTQFNGKYYP